MTTNVFPSNLQWFGFAKETTYGTAAAAPTYFVPMLNPKWVPTPTTLTDDGLRGGMGKTYGLQQGLRFDKFTYSTYPYMDSVYPHLMAVLGTADAVTGSADPYTHKTALYNGNGTDGAQPPSYTIWYFDAAGKCWKSAGCKAVSVKIDIKAEALIGLDADWTGLPAVPVTPPSNTPTGLPPMPSWGATITVGGTPLSKYSEVSLTYTRATEMVPTLTGTQTPVEIYAGELDVTGSMTAVYQGSTDNDLAALLANTQPALLAKIAPAGDATHSLTLQHSQVAYTASSPQGNKWMEIASSITAIANATDALGGGLSPAQAVFTTATSTAY